MTDLKNKIAETAEHAKNVATETTNKVGHAISEGIHEGERALSMVAREAKREKNKRADKVVSTVRGALQTAGDKLKDAGKRIRNPSD